MNELVLILDRAEFFQIGRALQRGYGREVLGDVVLDARDGRLRIESAFGGGEVAFVVQDLARATVTAKAFCSLIASRSRQKEPAGFMKLRFNPTLRKVVIDCGEYKARFSGEIESQPP